MIPKGHIDIRLLEDGTVRAETGDMAGVTHAAADQFLRELARLLGGAVTETKTRPQHHHHHHDDHAHHHH